MGHLVQLDTENDGIILSEDQNHDLPIFNLTDLESFGTDFVEIEVASSVHAIVHAEPDFDPVSETEAKRYSDADVEADPDPDPEHDSDPDVHNEPELNSDPC